MVNHNWALGGIVDPCNLKQYGSSRMTAFISRSGQSRERQGWIDRSHGHLLQSSTFFVQPQILFRPRPSAAQILPPLMQMKRVEATPTGCSPLCSPTPLTLLRGGSITFISHLMTALIYSICYCPVSCTHHPSHGQTPSNSLHSAHRTTWILNSCNTVFHPHSLHDRLQ